MKQGLEAFKAAVKAYLDGQAEKEEMFAKHYADPDKTLDNCVTYLLNYAKQSGSTVLPKEEIFGQALHFYTEPNIDPGKPLQCNVVCATRMQLTEEEKAEARREAIKQYQQEELRRMQQRNQPKPKAREEATTPQPSLFD